MKRFAEIPPDHFKVFQVVPGLIRFEIIVDTPTDRPVDITALRFDTTLKNLEALIEQAKTGQKA